MHRGVEKEPSVVMIAPGRAPKRPTRTKYQRKLLEKYRKRVKKLKSRVARQRLRIMQNTMLRMETAWNKSNNSHLLGPMSRLHKRMLACREQMHAD